MTMTRPHAARVSDPMSILCPYWFLCPYSFILETKNGSAIKGPKSLKERTTKFIVPNKNRPLERAKTVKPLNGTSEIRIITV